MTHSLIRLAAAVIALLAAAVVTDVRAQSAADPTRALKMYLESETTGLPGRVEVTVGALDERLRLAPCTNLEPFLPAGARLWGRTMLGMRCRETVAGSAGWSALVPVEIKVYGAALVATRPIAAGESPSAENLALQEVELTREAPGALNDLSQTVDKILARPLNSGQILRKDALRARPVVAAGDQVKLVANGNGFQISSYGKALNPAADGQQVRIQMETGRILTGTARGEKLVEIRL